MVARAGLEVMGAWGDFDGGDVSFDGHRLILLTRKSSASSGR